MEKWKLNYQYWFNNVDQTTKDMLAQLTHEEKQKYFANFINFGTAGIREKRGIGTININFITLGQFVYAFGKTLLKKYPKKQLSKGVLVIHDTRKYGKEFAEHTAKILSALDINVFLFNENKVCPTPLLSHLIITEGFLGGINITASHNTKEYSGIKFYDNIGKQIDLEFVTLIKEELQKNQDYINVPTADDKIEFLGYEVNDQYVKSLIDKIPLDKTTLFNAKENFSIIYTPSHGTGLELTEKILTKLKYKYYLVDEQCEQDENFSNSPIPNPQFEAAFTFAKQYGNKYNADLLVASDPDADRFGIMVQKDQKWVLLSGNDVPIIQLYFITKFWKNNNKSLKNNFVVKSIVTSNYAKNILEQFDVETVETFTGFKWITEKAQQILTEQKDKKLLFAWEEANGSIIDWTIARDKDFFQSLISVLEIAYYYKSKFNKSLLDLLDDIQKEYGFYQDDLITLKLEKTDLDYFKIKALILEKIKANNFNHHPIQEVIDFSTGYKDFPKTETLIIKFDRHSFMALRNSGTEPIIKIYLSLENKIEHKLNDLHQEISKFFDQLILN